MIATKEVCEKAVVELRRRGFDALHCATAEEAKEIVLQEAKKALSVGFGGSVTIKSLGLVEALTADGKEILRHGDPSLTLEQKSEVMRRELTCDLFLLSANALTTDGILVNVDGNGNRVAASIYGPKEVIFVVGRNKLVDGNVAAALERIREKASAPNCVRLGKKTPCAVTGKCTDCSSPDRICMVTVIMDRKPRSTNIKVLVVDEDLGY